LLEYSICPLDVKLNDTPDISPVLVKSNDAHDPLAILYNPVAVNNSDATPVVTVIYAIKEIVELLLKLIPET